MGNTRQNRAVIIQDDTSLINIFKEFMYSIRLSGITMNTYVDALDRFKIFVKGTPLTDVCHSDFKDFFRYLRLKKGYSQSYINQYISALRRFYRFIYTLGLTSEDISFYVPSCRSTAGKKIPRFLTESEVVKVIERGPDITTRKGIRDRAILEVLYATGIRVQELLNLTVGDIKFNEAMLYVLGKGGKPRYVPVGRKALEALEVYLKAREHIVEGKNNTLFLTLKGRFVRSSGTIWEIVNYYCKKVLGRSGSTHMLRHTCASHELWNGMDLRYIQVQLGHDNVSTTARYTHINLKYLKEQHSKLFNRHPHTRGKIAGEVSEGAD